MVEFESPLGDAYRTGSFGNFANGTGVALSEVQPGSIVQVAGFGPTGIRETIERVCGLAIEDRPGAGVVAPDIRGFGIAPGRWLLVADADADDLAAKLRVEVSATEGSVTDLTHGRMVIRIDGDKAEWVLSKLFALDFSRQAFAVGEGRVTIHHEINAAIQRVDEQAFELVVFRSFARSFWQLLCRLSESEGYVVR